MEVRLFLEHITQERFAIDASDKWSANVWSVDCCVLNIGARRPEDEMALPPRDRGFVLRQEGEGGIFWDPISNAVYTVDSEAYHAMLELDRGTSEVEVARRLGVELEAVSGLVQTLCEIRDASEAMAQE